MAAKLLNQAVVIVNKPGAGGSLALSQLAKAKADGYTVGNFNISGPMANAISKTAGFDSLKDFAPICRLAAMPNVMVTPAASPFKTVKDVVEAAKKKAGQVTGASSGVGTSQHFNLELFKYAAKVDITHVPHKGSTPAVTALLGGHNDIGFINASDVVQQIQAGKLRGLAVTSPQRMKELPDVPTVAEVGFPESVIISWFGLVAPAGTPAEVVAKLDAAFKKATEDPEVVAKIKAVGADTAYLPPKEFTDYIKTEYDKYMKIAKEAKIEE